MTSEQPPNTAVLDWREVGGKPIRADAPAGDSLDSDPSYETLRTQIQSSFSGQSVDWAQIASFGREILSHKSKHLLVGNYVCFSLFQYEGYSGLLDGLSCLREMLDRFWDCLYPREIPLRIRSLEWLGEKLERTIARRSPPAGAECFLMPCIERIQALDALLRLHQSEFPKCTSIVSKLSEYAETPSTSPSSKRETPANGSSAIQSRADIPQANEPVRTLRHAQELLRQAALTVYAQSPTLPWVYRAVRANVWVDVDDYPPNQSGKTKIPPPSARSLESYQDMLAKQSWSQVLSRAEADLHEAPFWLDLQRYSATALKQLGSEYEKAHAVVTCECEKLLGRLPELLTFTFSNGQPLADERTRRWAADFLPSRRGEDDEEKYQGNDVSENLAALRQSWADLFKVGDLNRAIDQFQGTLRASTSQRSAFAVRLEFAKLCFEKGHLRAASAQFEILDEAISHFDLQQWEPELARAVLLRWSKTLSRLSNESRSVSPTIVSQAERVYSRLSHLDIRFTFDVTSNSFL